MHFKQHVALNMQSWPILVSGSLPCARRWTHSSRNTQEDITGTTTLALYKGNVSVVAASSRIRCTVPISRPSLWVTAMTRKMRRDSFAFWGCLAVPAPVLPARTLPKPEGDAIRGDEMKMWSGDSASRSMPTSSAGSGRSTSTGVCCGKRLAASRSHATALKNAGILSSSELIPSSRVSSRLREGRATPAFLEDDDAETCITSSRNNWSR